MNDVPPVGDAGGEASEGPGAPHPITPVLSPGAQASPDRHAAAARWVLAQAESLMRPAQRIDAEGGFERALEDHSPWAVAFLTGYLYDAVATLPPDDPWRRLNALIDLEQVATGVPTRDPEKRLAHRARLSDPLPASTGAFNEEGKPFGSVADAADLVYPDLPDPSQDSGLVAVARPLSPLSAAILGFASGDPDVLHMVTSRTYTELWNASYQGVIDVTAPVAMIATMGDALRWVFYRRRVYTIDADGFQTMSGFAWVMKADRLAQGEKSMSEEVGKVDDGRIDPGAYRGLTE